MDVCIKTKKHGQKSIAQNNTNNIMKLLPEILLLQVSVVQSISQAFSCPYHPIAEKISIAEFATP